MEETQSQNNLQESNRTEEIPVQTFREDEDSDDDGPVQGSEFDMSYSFENMRRTRLLESNEPEPFHFYEFGLHPVGFQDLLKSIKTMKHHRSQTASPKSRSRKIKTFDIRAYQKTIDLQKSLPSSSKQFRISAFHPKTPKWDGSFTPDPELMKELYRIPCRDPTGKVIFSLARDDGKLPEGKRPWKPSDAPRDLPPPTFDQCSLSFQKQALLHLTHVIKAVEEQYRKMPGKTQEQSTLRANVGADLNNLRMERDRVIEKIRNNPDLLEHHQDLLEIITNSNGKARSPPKASGHH